MLALENAQKTEALGIAAPKAEYYDEMVERGATLTPTEVATALNLPAYRSAEKVNQLMEKLSCIGDRGFCYQICSNEPLYFGAIN